MSGKPDQSTVSPDRLALFMCAAHCQGGHSAAGASAALALGVPFPITMEALVKKARKEGLSPAEVYPWLTTPSFDPSRYFTDDEMARARS